MKHLKLQVFGKVQGVFFRASTKEKADELEIKGFVRNEPDGSVYIEAEGDDINLEEFKKWCRHGPRMAKVSEVSETGGELINFDRFEILR